MVLPSFLFSSEKLFLQVSNFITESNILLWVRVQSISMPFSSLLLWPFLTPNVKVKHNMYDPPSQCHAARPLQMPQYLNHTYKYHGAGSFTQPEVLQPVLFILILALDLPGFWPGFRKTRRRGKGRQRGARGGTGEGGLGGGAQERLAGEGTRNLLPLFIALCTTGGECTSHQIAPIHTVFQWCDCGNNINNSRKNMKI